MGKGDMDLPDVLHIVKHRDGVRRCPLEPDGHKNDETIGPSWQIQWPIIHTVLRVISRGQERVFQVVIYGFPLKGGQNHFHRDKKAFQNPQFEARVHRVGQLHGMSGMHKGRHGEAGKGAHT